MNANELADVLMSTKFQVDEDGTMIGVSHQAVDEAATMLRQQQAEIEALKSRELTDEEIMDEWWHETMNGWEMHKDTLLNFARAILKKAQEK